MTTHMMPLASRILAVGMGGNPGEVVFWADSPNIMATKMRRVFRVFGTGEPIPLGWVWRGTVQVPGYPLVLHLMEQDTMAGYVDPED